MKIEVNITKTRFFVLLGAVLVLGLSMFVYAYTNPPVGGNPSVFGHSVDEIDWNQYIPHDVGIDKSSLYFRASDSANGYGWFVNSPDRLNENAPLVFSSQINGQVVERAVLMNGGVLNVQNDVCIGYTSGQGKCLSSLGSVCAVDQVLVGRNSDGTPICATVQYNTPVNQNVLVNQNSYSSLIGTSSSAPAYSGFAKPSGNWGSNCVVGTDIYSEDGNYYTNSPLPLFCKRSAGGGIGIQGLSSNTASITKICEYYQGTVVGTPGYSSWSSYGNENMWVWDVNKNKWRIYLSGDSSKPASPGSYVSSLACAVKKTTLTIVS